MKHATYRAVVLLTVAAAALSCSNAGTRAVLAVPNYKTLQGDISNDLGVKEIAEGETINTDGDVDLVISARYKDGSVAEQSVIDQIRECGTTVCSVEMLLAPGAEVLFDAVASSGGTVVRRGVTAATLAEGEQTDVLLTMWPATRHAAEGTVTSLDVVRGATSLALVLAFDTDIAEPAFVADNANVGGQLALDFSASGFAPISGPLAQGLEPDTTTHLILLNGTPAGSYFPLLPADTGVAVEVQGQPAALLSYQIYGKIVVLTLPYDYVANREVVLAGSLVGHVSVGNADPVRIPAQGSIALNP